MKTANCFFHNPDEENGYLSNWYLSKFTLDGVDFTSAEQAMMYYKAKLFGDSEIAEKILANDNVAEIKALGRKVGGYNEEEWEKNRTKAMVKILYAKFSGNDTLRCLLLGTGDGIIAECAVKDRIWGIGLSMQDERRYFISEWRGRNLLGYSLMKVRDMLREEMK